MIGISKSERKKFNLDGLLHEKMPEVVRTIASVPEAEETAERLIHAAWSAAATEVSINYACLSVLSIVVGIACGVSASFNAHIPVVAASGIVALVLSTAISKHSLGKATEFSKPQNDPKNLYKLDPNAWQNKGVYRRAEKKINQMVLALQSPRPNP